MSYRGFASMVSRVLAGGVEELADAVDDASLRDFLSEPFLASSLYDVLPLRPLFATLARMLGASFDDLVATSSTAQARYDAKASFRELFGGITLADWHEKSPRLVALYYNFGHGEATRVDARHAIVRHHGVPAYLAPWFAPMQCAYSEETVRLIGGKNVRTEVLPWEPFLETDGLPTVVTGAHVYWE